METLHGSNPNIYEKTLRLALLLLAELYLQFSVFQFFVTGHERILRALKWYAAVLALAAVVYAVFLMVGRKKNPEIFLQKTAFLRSMKSYEQLFLVFLFFWYVFSAVMCQHTFGQFFSAGFFFAGNDTWMFITGLIAFLFFPFARWAGAERAKATIEALLKTVLIPYAVFIVWFLWQTFHGNNVTFPSGGKIMLEGQNVLTLSSLNHNTLASQAMAMCGIALYLAATQKPVQKVFYSLCIVVFTIFLALTNSRNYWFCNALMLCLATALFCIYRLETKKLIVRLVLGIGIAAILGIILHWFREEMFVLLNAALTQISTAEAALAPTAAGKVNTASYQLQTLAHSAGYPQTLASEGESAAGFSRSFVDNFVTVGNRLPLYKASLSVMFTNRFCFLFGYTPLIVVDVLRGIHGVSDTYNYTHLHNLFLQMGMSFGVPTMMATVAFSASLLVRSIRIFFRHRKELFPGAWLVPLVTICILASDMIEAELNSSTFLICVVFYLFAGWTTALDDVSSSEEKKRDRQRAWIVTAELVVLAALAFLLFPWFTTFRNTIDTGNAVRSRYFLIFIGLVALALFVWELAQILGMLLQHRKPEKWRATLAGSLALCLAGCLVFADLQMNRIAEQNAETLKQERPAIEAIQSISSCGLIAENKPELYRRTFGVVSRSLDKGDELAQAQNVALITDADTEYNTLISRGYLYAEISDDHAVYVNSAEAIEALKAAGYHLTGYYSRNRALDLNAASLASYGKPVNEDGTIHLSELGPLSKGEKQTLYSSAYHATYDLRLITESGYALLTPDDVVATLTVTAQGGQTVAAKRDVLFSEFNKDGTCGAALDFTVSSVNDAEFLIEPKQDDYPLVLEAIHYRKNPDYDTHPVYNARGKRVSEAYFDLEGEPFTISDGSQRKTFVYDDDGNLAEIHYFDADMTPILNTSGYAEVRRVFNENNQLMREEYCDTAGRPVNIDIGYAAYENVYDTQERLSLTYYYDAEGKPVECGSSYFHEYLTELARQKDITIFLAVKDDGSKALTPILLDDLKALGIQTDLSGKHRNSYYAVISPEGVAEEISADHAVSHSGTASGVTYTVTSAGYSAGNYSSIAIDGIEHSQNTRGMNIVVVEDGVVTESIAFDTYSKTMAVTGDH